MIAHLDDLGRELLKLLIIFVFFSCKFVIVNKDGLESVDIGATPVAVLRAVTTTHCIVREHGHKLLGCWHQLILRHDTMDKKTHKNYSLQHLNNITNLKSNLNPIQIINLNQRIL